MSSHSSKKKKKKKRERNQSTAGKRKKKEETEEKWEEGGDTVVCIHRYGLASPPETRRGFQSSRLQAELIPRKIQKFGKREEPRMKLAVAGSYLEAGWIRATCWPVRNPITRIDRSRIIE